MSKTRIVIEVRDGEIVCIGETGHVEEMDRIEVILIDHDWDDNPQVTKLVPDWQAPTASEMFQENPDIYEQLKEIEK